MYTTCVFWIWESVCETIAMVEAINMPIMSMLSMVLMVFHYFSKILATITASYLQSDHLIRKGPLCNSLRVETEGG